MRKIIVAQKLKEFRKQNHYTQQQLGELLGVSSQSVSKWERKECYPDISILPMLADLMGCLVDDFFE